MGLPPAKSHERLLPRDCALRGLRLRGLTRLPWISGAFCRKFAGSPVCPRIPEPDPGTGSRNRIPEPDPPRVVFRPSRLTATAPRRRALIQCEQDAIFSKADRHTGGIADFSAGGPGFALVAP